MRSLVAPLMSTRSWVPALAALVACAMTAPAHADVVLNIQSVTANAGDAGDTLDVTLTNTGPAAVTIGGFLFEITTATSDIDFTQATTATSLSSYIFSGHSVFDPNITASAGQTLDAGDIYDPGGFGATVAAGTTVGLGHIFFDVAAGTAMGAITVSFAAGATSLADAAGGPITIDTLGTGTITVGTAGVVPEPATAFLAMTGLLVGLGYRWSRTRRRAD